VKWTVTAIAEPEGMAQRPAIAALFVMAQSHRMV
jgi:hypothetical protein